MLPFGTTFESAKHGNDFFSFRSPKKYFPRKYGIIVHERTYFFFSVLMHPPPASLLSHIQASLFHFSRVPPPPAEEGQEEEGGRDWERRGGRRRRGWGRRGQVLPHPDPRRRRRGLLPPAPAQGVGQGRGRRPVGRLQPALKELLLFLGRLGCVGIRCRSCIPSAGMFGKLTVPPVCTSSPWLFI